MACYPLNYKKKDFIFIEQGYMDMAADEQRKLKASESIEGMSIPAIIHILILWKAPETQLN